MARPPEQQPNQPEKPPPPAQQQADQKPEPQTAQPPQPDAPSSANQTNDFDKARAAALLDNLREDERNWNFFPEAQMRDLHEPSEPAKDW